MYNYTQEEINKIKAYSVKSGIAYIYVYDHAFYELKCEIFGHKLELDQFYDSEHIKRNMNTNNDDKVGIVLVCNICMKRFQYLAEKLE